MLLVIIINMLDWSEIIYVGYKYIELVQNIYE